MRGLTIVLAEADPARLRTALTMAAAWTALGGTARLFLDGGAVAAAQLPITDPADDTHVAAGLPALSALMADALADGVRLILCQSGMAMLGLTPDDMAAGAEYGGMIGVMAELGGDRLVVG
jgi:predicted peroxiredoxin